MKFQFWIALSVQLVLFGALNFFGDWTLERMPIYFVTTAILCGLAYLLAATDFQRAESSSPRRALWIFWCVTIALRLLAFPLPSANEIWRYRADGIIQRSGFNPYAIAPSDPRVSEKIGELGAVPRAEEPTGYAPGPEILFRLIPATRDPFVWKILFGAIELLAIALLLRVIDLRSASWFAWNPLLAYSFSGAAHFDSIVLLCLVALIFFLSRFTEKKQNWFDAIGASVALGVAISFRPIAIVLCLPMLFALRWKAVCALISLAIPLAIASPFRDSGRAGLAFSAIRNLFGDFPNVSRINDLFWWLIEDRYFSNWHQQLFRYDVVILIVSAVVSLIFVRNWRRGMLWSLGSALILAPALPPWYVTWILPIATWRRAYAWHFLSVTIFAYYLFFSGRLFALPWHADSWLHQIILVPVLLALLLLARQRWLLPKSGVAAASENAS